MANGLKKIFITNIEPFIGETPLFRLWRLTHADAPLYQPDLDAEMAKVAAELGEHRGQMRKQQVHIDEIKRLCHVPTG